MSVRSDVVSALSSASVPVYFQKWIGDDQPPARYFVFTTMTVPDRYHDDTQKWRKHYVYLNLYSDTDYSSLVSTIRSGMAGKGFAPVSEMDATDTDYQGGAHDGYIFSSTWSIREAVT